MKKEVKKEAKPSICLLEHQFCILADENIKDEMDVFDWILLATQAGLPALESHCVQRLLESFQSYVRLYHVTVCEIQR